MTHDNREIIDYPDHNPLDLDDDVAQMLKDHYWLVLSGNVQNTDFCLEYQTLEVNDIIQRKPDVCRVHSGFVGQHINILHACLILKH